MNTLIRDAKIIDPASPWNGKKVDIRIRKGRIEEIGKALEKKNETEIRAKGLLVSPGWIDMNVQFRDPGHEYKEDLKSGLKAARAGGFTSVLHMPSTFPVMDSKASLEYLKQRSQGSGVHVYAAAALSKGCEGQELSEMFDLHDAGALMFSDVEHSVMDSGLMKKALLYAKNFNGLVCSFPQDRGLAAGTMMNEGPLSTLLGMKGSPHMAETIHLRRDIDLLRYTESRLHVVGLSTAEGVKLVKEAKKEGLNITAEVFLSHLLWTDAQVDGYQSLYKMTPPLRTEKDRKALIKGIQEGTIDCISSQHRPEDVEHKKLEFGLANSGIALMESFFPLYQTYLSEELSLELFIQCLSDRACKVLGQEAARIDLGREAILTCFSCTEASPITGLHSKAYNRAPLKEGMKGRVVGTVRA